jgi:hypothetical protein
LWNGCPPKVWKEKIEPGILYHGLTERIGTNQADGYDLEYLLYNLGDTGIQFLFADHWDGLCIEDGTWTRFLNLSAILSVFAFVEPVMGFGYCLNIVLARAGRWQPVTRWLNAGLKLGFLSS